MYFLPFAGARGQMGPPGPPGPPGSGDTTQYVADEVISGLRVVRLSGDGHVKLARREESESTSPLGIALQAAPMGGTLSVSEMGEVQDQSWSWSSGQYVFLGEDGQVQAQPPAAGMSMVIGTAVSPTAIMLRIQPPIFLL